jgi:hypothetical protein
MPGSPRQLDLEAVLDGQHTRHIRARGAAIADPAATADTERMDRKQHQTAGSLGLQASICTAKKERAFSPPEAREDEHRPADFAPWHEAPRRDTIL